jgi:acid phosphatase
MSRTNRTARGLPVLAALILAGCAVQPGTETDDGIDLGLRWVRDAAEWQALALQAYAAAAEDLPRFLEDKQWSALPDQRDAEDLPPAIIFDVDETLVSNVDFQIALEPPFRNTKLDEWNATHEARPVPGAAQFVQLAIDSGVEVFFVTNRPCQAKPGVDRFCPQQDTTIHDLIETGIPANAERVMMAAERPDWTGEKKVRRDLIAQSYRVIMLIGDDLGDFIPCVRSTVVPPCTEPATQALRKATTEAHSGYWGNGWYILPNPMHGSWTSVE